MRQFVILLAAVVFGLMQCSPAHADLGNCIVLCRCNGQLGAGTEKVVSRFIYDAYARSQDGDQDLLFVLELRGASPRGEYSISKARLVLGETWSIHGCKIHAGSIHGLMNGVVEIGMALEADRGSIHRLKPGPRSGLLDEPLYEKQDGADGRQSVEAGDGP